MDIPYDKLNIPDMFRKNLDPASPKPIRLATAKAALPVPPESLIGMLVVLAGDPDSDVQTAAQSSIKNFPNLVGVLNQRTHPKVLELIVKLREDPELDERIFVIRNINDKTAIKIAERANSRLCEQIASNHERMLITPKVLTALFHNKACADVDFERAKAFLRMEGTCPELPDVRGEKPPEPKKEPPKVPVSSLTPKPVTEKPVFDLEAEIEAALSGKASPILVARQKLEMFNVDTLASDGPIAGFSFDFKEDEEFSLDLIEESTDEPDNEVKLSISKKVAALPPGKKIKLAYVGNKEVRGLLIRDRNKQVALAVVKSGRMTDAEVASNAGNRNLSSEVLREIGSNGEWLRKYPVKVALVNNPRCPPSIAVGIVNQLQARDLAALGRNKNVSSVIFTMAQKLVKEKQR
jgi:hypothetical protein